MAKAAKPVSTKPPFLTNQTRNTGKKNFKGSLENKAHEAGETKAAEAAEAKKKPRKK